MGPVLIEYFEAMVHKLNVNAHKDAISSDDIDGLLDKMAEEVQEFRDQRLQDAADPNILSELADIGNFAFLLYAYLRSRGVKDMRERFLDEYFDIRPDTGAVFCKKTRPGSPAKPGEHVRGTFRNGVRYLRSQSAASGVVVSAPFRDLMWWKHHGEWPTRPLRYKIEDPLDERLTTTGRYIDAISNLEMVPEAEGRRYPFVSQYKPKGREDSENYGKWVYQRRHAFVLIRVGYWDTEEEAAREGVIAWKQRVKEKNKCSNAN